MFIPAAIKHALRLRCPACGKGPLYRGLLAVNTECGHCRFPLKKHDAADGPAYVVMFAVSIAIITAALWVEFHYNPPVWVHILLWPALTVATSLLLLRYVKALFIAVQYHHNTDEFKK